MKPTPAKTKPSTSAAPHCSRIAPRHVPVEFLPQTDWSLPVGIPSVRHQQPAAAEPCTTGCVLGFAPIELVIAKANKKQNRRHWDRHEPLWVGSVIN